MREGRQKRLEIAAQLRVVMYLRVSKPGDKSIRDQESVGRRDLLEQGLTVVAVFSDKMSASTYRRVQDRPGFIETKDFIRGGHADLLWTFAGNRAHRDLDDYTALRRLCIDTGTLWRYGKRTYDLSKPADRRDANADAIRAEGQSDDISEAVNRGIQEALDEGKAHGKLPRGYRIIRDANTGDALRRELIPEQAELIRDAAMRLLDRESLSSVTRDFAQKWPKVGGKGVILNTTLRATMINPTYAGLRTYRGKVVRAGNWEPLFTVEEHQRLRALLTDPARTHHRGTAPTHLLSLIATCGMCGAPVRAKNTQSRRRNRLPSYRCPKSHVSRPIAAVDKHVETVLFSLAEDPAFLAIVNAPADEADPVSVDRELAAIEELERGLVEFAKDAAREKLSVVVVKAYSAEVEAQIAEHRARIDAVAGEPAFAEVFGPDAVKRWERRDIVDKRRIIRRWLRVEIVPIGSGSKDLGVEIYPNRPGVSGAGS